MYFSVACLHDQDEEEQARAIHLGVPSVDSQVLNSPILDADSSLLNTLHIIGRIFKPNSIREGCSSNSTQIWDHDGIDYGVVLGCLGDDPLRVFIEQP
ncbi:hypothetical protein L1987_18832 [Smallanthus sonchifolius]|uniref:Uncharacterized protein n=1 Tax=Smallanthus sonchifolius TaxID=185202 RepID=A0ACB9J172_9ASTR|nr:hypothetical protein L1987_18832 [Smallanthus sonchifolius]